jgi:hypothetical protein
MKISITSHPAPASVDKHGRVPAQEWAHGTVTLPDGTTAAICGRGTQWYAESPGKRGQGRGRTPELAARDLINVRSQILADGQPACFGYPHRCDSCGPDYLTDTDCHRSQC